VEKKMANRLITTETPPALSDALKSAAKLTAGNPLPDEEGDGQPEAENDTPRPTAVRLNAQEYEYLKKSLPLADMDLRCHQAGRCPPFT
jgi:hypothetical protein